MKKGLSRMRDDVSVISRLFDVQMETRVKCLLVSSSQSSSLCVPFRMHNFPLNDVMF